MKNQIKNNWIGNGIIILTVVVIVAIVSMLIVPIVGDVYIEYKEFLANVFQYLVGIAFISSVVLIVPSFLKKMSFPYFLAGIGILYALACFQGMDIPVRWVILTQKLSMFFCPILAMCLFVQAAIGAGNCFSKLFKEND